MGAFTQAQPKQFRDPSWDEGEYVWVKSSLTVGDIQRIAAASTGAFDSNGNIVDMSAGAGSLATILDILIDHWTFTNEQGMTMPKNEKTCAQLDMAYATAILSQLSPDAIKGISQAQAQGFTTPPTVGLQAKPVLNLPNS